jgi:hypothetical protein
MTETETSTGRKKKPYGRKQHERKRERNTKRE